MRKNTIQHWLTFSIVITSALATTSCSVDSQSFNKVPSDLVAKPSFKFNNIEFEANSQWQLTGDVTLSADKQSFNLSTGDNILLNRPAGNLLAKGNRLTTKAKYQDVHFKVDLNITASASSGIYFQDRYRLNISDIFDKKKWWSTWMGGIHPRFDDDREWKHYDGVTAKANPSKPPGQWQTLEVDFKAPRFDSDGYKTEYAQFVSVKLNGVSIHQHQIATGPSRFASMLNETSFGAISFLGDSAPIAFRNLTIESRDFSDVSPAKPLKAGDEIPLGELKGKPMHNLVAFGKQLFQDKGCKECHAVEANATSVKTGPNLYGVFTNKAKLLSVYDASEQHNTKIKADHAYLIQSIRKPTLHLAVRTLTDGSEKRFLPVMPSFNAEALSDSEADALMHYLKTLNKASEQGKKTVWQEQPEKPYVLVDDLSAELVSDQPRLARVNIGEEVSGRAYHVGLPNQKNYSFDPRTLAVEMIWSGRFLSLKNEKQGRADAPSTIGKGAKKWASISLKHLFQPVLSNGKPVDFYFKEPNTLSQSAVHELLHTKEDFNDKRNLIDAAFVGVNSPLASIPQFNYRVENNKVTMQLTIKEDNQLVADFVVNTRSQLKLTLDQNHLNNIKISHGEIKAGLWLIPAGLNTKVSFSAYVNNAPQIKPIEDNIVAQSNDKQALVWSDASNDKTSLPAGYRIENALAPNDKFGRQVLFEPLGIAFTELGNTFVSTRTSGVWKVTNNQWQQFAEGVFDSLGVVVEQENTIVIGEKPGLTRLRDENNDGWAESRENVSDHFMFNSNYHEYLHGPIRTSRGEYVFTLNLGHSLPNGYGGEGSMLTAGGYRGWAMKVDTKGKTTPFANGLRSPAGLAITEHDKMYYTDNQGDFHGTSKLHVLKPDTYYGHPAGLVDLPGMTPKNKEIHWTSMKNKRDLAVGLLPHARAMNSPGSPVWDETEGGFGPYQGQMFVGDQSQSNIFRVHTETINGIEQSALLPFMAVTSSGVLRLAFSPKDNSMWIGQTGRGWWAKGGNLSALQRIVYDGKTIPQSIYSIEVQPNGFKVNFTQPIKANQQASFKALVITSWFYNEDFNYGSEEKGNRTESTSISKWSDDGKTVFVKVDNFSVDKKLSAEQTSRVYEVDLTQTAFGKTLNSFHAKAWYTLNAIPK